MLFNTLFVKESVKNDFINQKRGIYMNGERKILFKENVVSKSFIPFSIFCKRKCTYCEL